MNVNIEQAAWYIERDGAKRVRTLPDGTDEYASSYASGGELRFWVPVELQRELDERRDRVYGILMDRKRKEQLR